MKKDACVTVCVTAGVFYFLKQHLHFFCDC